MPSFLNLSELRILAVFIYMSPTKRLKHWQFFFIIASLEGGFALFKLLSIPTDSSNALILGLSASRLLMAVILFFAIFFFLGLLFLTKRKGKFREYLNPQNYPKAYSLLNWLSFFLALFTSIILFFLRYYDPEKYLPLYLRAAPLVFYIIVLGYQLSLWLFYLRNKTKKSTKPVLSRDEVFVDKISLIIFAIFLALFAFVSITRIGLIPDTAYWSEPGIAIQGWQFILALTLGFLTLLFSYRKTSKKLGNIFIPLLIWSIAVIIWWSVPMEVLKNSFYAPFAYPLGKSLPYSDAGFYDYLSQGLLLGQGFITQIPPRPLYIVFLTGLRALVGINNYDHIMLGQTLFYALFPVLLYFLGKTLHSKEAGIVIAFLGIFREWTNLLVSSQTRVSNSRMTLTDLPTALVLGLVALVIIYWLKQSQSLSGAMTKGKSADEGLPFVAGGVFGMLLLLRTQTMLILPFVFLLSFFAYLPNWKKWIKGSLIFIFGLALVISPWLTRNAKLTGKFTFDDPKQLSVLASQYRKTDNLSLDFDYENESVSNSVLEFALENPLYVSHFIATHFLSTEINGLNALPHIEPFYGFQEPINIYWTNWDGHISLANQFLLVFYLAIIALGIGTAWRKLKWAGLVPLAINLGYALSNGIARFSGWRYDFPGDWVAYFYFGIGFIELVIILASLLGISSPSRQGFSPSVKKTPHLYKKIFFSAVFFLIIGFSPILLEKNIPAHYPALTEEELLTAIVPYSAEVATFAEQENAKIVMGRLIYPRYYYRNDGMVSANPWPAYDAQDFSRMGFILIKDKRVDMVFPVKDMPATFPNGVDVIVLGCLTDTHIESRLVYVIDEEKTIISEKGFVFCSSGE